jgi:hypothetical protein
MVAVLALVAVIRLHLLAVPLERDEGEYAYAGQLILQGIPPYELAYNMKFPGTYLGYAIIMGLFGQTQEGIHLGIFLMTTATALMLFWLGKKMLDEIAGVVAATSYAVLAASPSMLGLAGHATHFCAFFATAGLCLMWRARQKESWRLVTAFGFCFGMAVLMKQHAAFIATWAGLAFAAAKLLDKKNPIGQRFAAVALCAGAMLLPILLCCLWLWHAGVFAKFKFWTLDYAREYVTILPWSYVPAIFRENFFTVAGPQIMFWLLAGAGLILVWFDRRLRGSRLWLVGFSVASSLAIIPGFYFRGHYFLLTLPAVALLAGATVSAAGELWRQRAPASPLRFFPMAAFALALALTMIANRYVLTVNCQQAARWFYGQKPYAEAEAFGAYLFVHAPANARLAVLGSEPEIYFYAHRHSVTGYIYTCGLMEAQPFARRMQDEMIHEIETNAPDYIVFANEATSWLQGPDSDLKIFHWWDDYKTNYTLTALADVISTTNTHYAWGPDALAYGKLRSGGLELYKRIAPPATPAR